MVSPARGELWLADLDKRRPVVVVHRDFAGQRLNTVLSVPLTTRQIGVPTEVTLSPGSGVKLTSYARADNLSNLPKSVFVRRLGTVADTTMAELCGAIATALDCPTDA